LGTKNSAIPKSLEHKNGPARAADFSILKAVRTSYPHAVTLRDLGMNKHLPPKSRAVYSVIFQRRQNLVNLSLLHTITIAFLLFVKEKKKWHGPASLGRGASNE
jgi:hypothetical protein